MKIQETGIEGLVVIEPAVYNDERGYFYESYNKKRFFDNGLDAIFVQDNESKSSYGVVRGLHFQKKPHDQTKLLRVIDGEILDVALDIRKGSKTFGQYYSVVLSAENKKQFYIPKGFAHGFSVLSKTAIVNYKCDNLYNKESEGGINLFDKSLNIDWRIKSPDVILSDKDKMWPDLAKLDYFF